MNVIVFNRHAAYRISNLCITLWLHVLFLRSGDRQGTVIGCLEFSGDVEVTC